MTAKRVIASRRTVLSPWVSLMEHDVTCNGRTETFHALDQSDYVNVLALTPEVNVLLVKPPEASVMRSSTAKPDFSPLRRAVRR